MKPMIQATYSSPRFSADTAQQETFGGTIEPLFYPIHIRLPFSLLRINRLQHLIRQSQTMLGQRIIRLKIRQRRA